MKRFLLCAAAVMLLSMHASAQSQAPKREFRGVWVATVTNIDWPSSSTYSNPEKQKADLIALFDKLAASGCNAVMFQVRPECDALYDSPYEPWSYWLTGEQGRSPFPYYDPLAFAVDEAHKRGMELHAWFNPYRAERSAGNYTTSPKHVTKQHPEWVLQVGSVKFLNPGLKEVRDYNAKVIADVVRRYDIDAAHMDDYFYVEGITAAQDAAAYAADPRGLSLADWRRDNVNRLLKQVYDSIQVIKPNVRWGISPRGIWRNGVPSGIIGADNYNEIYCDAVAWMQGKYIDYLAPQLYWKTGGSQDYAKLMPWWSSQKNGRHLYPGLAIYRIGASTYGDAGMPASQIRLNRSTALTEGSILYTANNVTGNTGGITDTLINTLYKYKAIPPSYSWKDSVKPNAPQNLRYAKVPGRPIAQLMWDLPAKAADGDTAVRYVIYRFDHGSVQASELDDARNINQITSLRSVTPAVSASNQTTYFVVTSLDMNNNESAMSSVASISVPPSIALSLPASGSVNQPQGVVVSWKGVETASMYHLQVSSDSTFQTGFIVNDASITDTSKAVMGLTGQRQYYWRVRGVNAAGSGDFSQARTFTTGFPSTVVLAAPANYFASAPASGAVAWMKNPSAQTYRVQLSAGSDFSVNIIDTTGLSDTTITYANLDVPKIYFWRVAGTNATGVSNWSETWRFRTAVVAGVERSPSASPTEFSLGQNYPNPFNPETSIGFTVSAPRFVHLAVYDVLGREVSVLVNEHMQPGTYRMRWNGSGLPSGIYFYRMNAGNFNEVKKMLLQK
ncbi:MAG: family 10 glycosylhydrolase [Acidobacteriota bacterium]